MKRYLGLLVCVISVAAGARQDNGALSVVLSPNEGKPVIVSAGTTFEAVLTHKGELHLADADGAIALDAEWAESPTGQFTAQCSVPDDVPPGFYALRVTVDGADDATTRAVQVVKAISDTYRVAHISNVRAGSGPEAREALRSALRQVNDSGVLFAVITGNLTEHGAPEEFAECIRVLEECRVPTLVCPGPNDVAQNAYAQFFAARTYAFWCGEDAYLVFDSTHRTPFDVSTKADADAHVFRRATKAARWSFGVTHQFDVYMPLQRQIALYVDNPIDYLLVGDADAHTAGRLNTVPWASYQDSIHILYPRTAQRSALQIMEVTPKGALPVGAE